MSAARPSKFSQAVKAYRAGKLASARKLLAKQLKHTPNNADALHLAGIVERELQNHEDAIALLRRAARLRADMPAVHANLGAALHDAGEHDGAQASYRKALALDQSYVVAINGLAVTLGAAGDSQAAVKLLRKAIETAPTFAQAHHNLAVQLHARDEIDEALQYACAAQEMLPNNPEVLEHYGELCRVRNQPSKATAVLDRAIELSPGRLKSRWLKMHTFPLVFQNEAQVQEHHGRWRAELKRFDKALRLQSRRGVDEAVEAVSSATNFFAHYLDRLTLQDQTDYGRVLTKVAHKRYPAHARRRDLRPRPSNEPIRVGFVSSFFRKHSVAKSHASWIRWLHADQFEVSVFYLGTIVDSTTQSIREHCTAFEMLGGVAADEVIHRIDKGKLDVLIYLDIGMTPLLNVVAPLQLAPVQCTTWGHPITSGLASIDYYLSSELMEAEDAARSYSETLITLPSLSVSYPQPHIDDAGERELELPQRGDGVTFLCSQSLFKLLPENDRVFANIAKALGTCQFYFIAALGEYQKIEFSKRLATAFSAQGLSFEDYVTVLDRLDHGAFLSLNKQVDIVLDSLHWSGFNSTMEALACGRVVLTVKGHTMRANHTSACLAMLGMDELVAIDAEALEAKAVELARSEEKLAELEGCIVANKEALFEDSAPLHELSRFLRQVASPKPGDSNTLVDQTSDVSLTQDAPR
ncbi:MAG: tetratricopeptide repeat protein [Pseudomonadota bacterium]